jgi:two-component system, sensor histidine kinase and response regulator
MTSTKTPPSGGTILIADDDTTVRILLRHVLEDEGYVIEEAANGKQALEMVQSNPPDLVLLDAIMPEIDGFEVVERMQTHPIASRVPVLIITGLDDDESVNHAFAVGAVDYVTKPVNWAVLRQRVRRLLNTRQLEKMRDNLTQMIVHDMKNPIATIRGFAEMLLSDADPASDNADLLARIYHSSNSLLDMTMNILDIGRLEEGKLTLERTTRCVAEVLEEVRQAFQWMASNYDVQLVAGTCDTDIHFMLDWNLIQRAIANLISNAIKHSKPGGTITVSCAGLFPPNATLKISVTDEGEGIDEQDKMRIFDKFTQASQRKRGSRTDTGLGLTFCKLATEAHDGRIELESTVGIGSTFTLAFPS